MKRLVSINKFISLCPDTCDPVICPQLSSHAYPDGYQLNHCHFLRNTNCSNYDMWSTTFELGIEAQVKNGLSKIHPSGQLKVLLFSIPSYPFPPLPPSPPHPPTPPPPLPFLPTLPDPQNSHMSHALPFQTAEMTGSLFDLIVLYSPTQRSGDLASVTNYCF